MADSSNHSDVSGIEPNQVMPLVEFARTHMGIELNDAQLEMLQYAAEGKTIIRGRTAGITTARDVAQAWLKYGLTGGIDLLSLDPDTKNRQAEAQE